MARTSLAARSIIAVSLMVGFYALALGVVAGLLYLPYAEARYGGRLHLRLALGCVIGAAAIAWSILPRRDVFQQPGPRLTTEQNPALFRVLKRVAARTGQALPSEMYLVPDVNAWVANRGGVMGFGSRRVMGLGSPLLQMLTVEELEAVVAHEFGHYHGGDTRLGPWIYKTRAAIGRTLGSLGAKGWLHIPFRAYGKFFLRVTLAISRAQEYSADRLAAAIVGAAPLIEGLKKVHACARAYPVYWQQEVAPVLGAGLLPPLAEGFTRFLQAPRIEKATNALLSEELAAGSAGTYDSHPPLRERIAAVESLRGEQSQRAKPFDAQEPAVSLLGDATASERAVLSFLNASMAARLVAVPWSVVASRVLAPAWRKQAERVAPLLAGTHFEDLSALLRSRSREILQAVGASVRDDQVPLAIAGPVGACIAVALLDAGWSPATDLGEPALVRLGDAQLEPGSVVPRILAGGDGEAWWEDFVTQHGLRGRTLGTGRPSNVAVGS